MREHYDSMETGRDQAYTVDDQAKSMVLGHSNCTTLKSYFSCCTVQLAVLNLPHHYLKSTTVLLGKVRMNAALQLRDAHL